MRCCVGRPFIIFLSIPPLDLLANLAIASGFQSEIFVARPEFEGHHVQKITAANNMMAPVIAINIRVTRPSTENFVAELSVVGEAATGAAVLDAAADPEPEPPKQSFPSPTQKNCTVPQICPNLQVHSSSL